MERNSELRDLVERRLRGGGISPQWVVERQQQQQEADDPWRLERDHLESELSRLSADNEALKARQLTVERMLDAAQHNNDRCVF